MTLPLYQKFGSMPVVSISHAQRLPLPGAAWLATVYHGLPEHLYTLHRQAGSYLAFLGRISPEKRVDRAIEIARRAGIPLRILNLRVGDSSIDLDLTRHEQDVGVNVLARTGPVAVTVTK